MVKLACISVGTSDYDVFGGNGDVLSNTITVIRGFAYNQVQAVLKLQVGELTFRDAISNVAISSIARQQLENLYSECQGKVGTELVECWDSKQTQAQATVSELKRKLNLHSNHYEILVVFSGIELYLVKSVLLFSLPMIQVVYLGILPYPIIRFILYALQWGFVTFLEAALLLTVICTDCSWFIVAAIARSSYLGVADWIYFLVWCSTWLQHLEWVCSCCISEIWCRVGI